MCYQTAINHTSSSYVLVNIIQDPLISKHYRNLIQKIVVQTEWIKLAAAFQYVNNMHNSENLIQ